MTVVIRKGYFLILTLLVVGSESIKAQKEQTRQGEASEEVNPVKQRFAKMEADAIKDPFRGIETDQGKMTGLFPVHATGVSTGPIQKAATHFLSSLDTVFRQRVEFEIDDNEWRKWCNVDNGIYDRQGMSLKEMNEVQKKAAFDLMRVSLSAKGLQLSKDIMKTDQTLRELNNNSDDFDEELYFFTLMGVPSVTEPWGWQLDGHHLIINYFVLGDQIVMSPVFMGAEPVNTTSGKYNGNTLFQDEQNIGLNFMRSLSKEQQTEATLFGVKKRNNNKASANKDNISLNYEGLVASDLSKEQKEDLLQLIYQYVKNIREGHDQIKMDEVSDHLDETWFAWVGETAEESVFYYRIYSPVILIEFDHQAPVGVPGSDHSKASRNHIHTVVRTPNGNDYGKDLLRQHKEKHHK
jgi:hypothetical protein